VAQWALLADLQPEEMRDVLRAARRRRFARNEVVFHRDDPGDSLHLIEKGRFAIRVMTPLGETAMVGVRGPGESFGEMALVSEGSRRSATVSALEEAETFALYRDAFEQLRAQHAGVTQLLINSLTQEIRKMDERLLEALYVPAERRILRRLVELAVVYPPRDGVVTIPLTQDTLAELAGASRSTVNKVLREEERRGVLELNRGVLRITDRDDIARRAR
jgi:CRP-like cAMP-binding protein